MLLTESGAGTVGCIAAACGGNLGACLSENMKAKQTIIGLYMP